ncbi:hypothetical protein [Candidatus Harpocratesius sp.]
MVNIKYSRAVFELLRLHHSLYLPFTGLSKEKSPIIRAGITTKFRNSLDRLYGNLL